MPRAAKHVQPTLADLRVGQRFISGSQMVSAADIVQFARQFDPQASHTDDKAATLTIFEGLAASGWHTAGITMKLLVDQHVDVVQIFQGAIMGPWRGEVCAVAAQRARRTTRTSRRR